MVAGRIHSHRPLAQPIGARPALPAGGAVATTVLDVATEVLVQIRRAKTTEKRSMRASWPLSPWPTRLTGSPPSCRPRTICATPAASSQLVTTPSDQLAVTVELAPED